MINNWFKEAHSEEQLLENGANQVWIKRDDLIHPIVSGNKWRKLKYVIGHCLENNISHIVTYGGAFSNHSIATACVCSLYNIKCSIIIRGEQPTEPNHYTLLLQSFAANLIYVSRTDYTDKQKVLEYVDYDENSTIILPEGGAHPLAHMGCGEILESLTQVYDAIFIASGTGTTALGMLKQLKESGLESHLYIVPVLKNEAEIESICEGFTNFTVVHGAHLGGYAKTNSAVFETIDNALSQFGILMDPVYTAKCYMAMRNWINDNNITNKKILMVHTGGQLGLFSDVMLKKWGAASEPFEGFKPSKGWGSS